MVRCFEKALLGASAVGLGLFLSASQASAHVKWFSTFDVATTPHSLDYLQMPDFRVLILLSLLFMALGSLLEESPLGAPVMRSFDSVT